MSFAKTRRCDHQQQNNQQREGREDYLCEERTRLSTRNDKLFRNSACDSRPQRATISSASVYMQMDAFVSTWQCDGCVRPCTHPFVTLSSTNRTFVMLDCLINVQHNWIIKYDLSFSLFVLLALQSTSLLLALLFFSFCILIPFSFTSYIHHRSLSISLSRPLSLYLSVFCLVQCFQVQKKIRKTWRIYFGKLVTIWNVVLINHSWIQFCISHGPQKPKIRLGAQPISCYTFRTKNILSSLAATQNWYHQETEVIRLVFFSSLCSPCKNSFGPEYLQLSSEIFTTD